MPEVVINKCFGGFGLSPRAIKRWCDLKEKPCYFFKEKEETRGDFSRVEYERISLEEAEKVRPFLLLASTKPDINTDEGDKGIIMHFELDRDDPDLIQVVKELGEEANGEHAKLKIVEVPDGVDWYVDEYDGQETVEEVHRSWG